MLKKILAIVTMMYAAVSFAAVDVNKASAAELDGIKGIGPGISTKILDERKKGNFKDWNDFIDRTKGVGEGNAAKFSAEGLTVNGATYKGAPAAKAATPAAPAPAAAPTAKEEKKDAKAEAKKAKAEEKAKKAEEAKAKKEAAKQAKADKKDAKAEAPKAAASAAKK
ncbi:MAG: helix-hairpin-helix domain-containing protein [Burkholderiales bacterium]|nr:helix-hairpin-helix domain-containing protein [Burkholderiales bacterium]